MKITESKLRKIIKEIVDDQHWIAGDPARDRSESERQGDGAIRKAGTEWQKGAPARAPAPAKRLGDLLETLESVGKGVVAMLANANSLRQCSFVAPQVMLFLQSEGFTVSGRGSGTPDHVDFSVLTADEGWVTVDPTHIQFEFSRDPTGNDKEELALYRRLAELWETPAKVFKIVRAGREPRPPLEPDAHKAALANHNRDREFIGSPAHSSLGSYFDSLANAIEAKLTGRRAIKSYEGWTRGIKEALEFIRRGM